MTTTIHHLDTSALVKWVLWPDIHEPGSQLLSDFMDNHSGFYTLDLCIGETFNVLKQKAFSRNESRRVLNNDGYQICINRILRMTAPKHSIHVITINLYDTQACDDAMKLTRDFNIDFVDALILLKARAMRPWHEDQNLLITADNNMKTAADSIGMPVLKCNSESLE